MKWLHWKPERIAGLFLLSLFGLAAVFAVVVGIRQGWFERKVSFSLQTTSANDIRPGSKVEMLGLPVGYVSEVAFGDASKVKITLRLRTSYAGLVTAGSTARVSRPLFIGDQTIEIVPDTTSQEAAPPGSELAMAESIDPLSMFKGAAFGEGIAKLYSLIANLDGIARQANQKHHLEQAVSDIAALTRDMRHAVPLYTNNAAELSGQINVIAKNLNGISTRINEMMPALQEVAKTAPDTAKVLNESLAETKILVKALERNFFIRGSVNDVREEQERNARLPSSAPKAAPKSSDSH
jgi:phospholipid/cholesterol/gamma-HCH transport system substrate-binding protein